MELLVKFDKSKKGNEYCALYLKKNGQYIVLTFDRPTIEKVVGFENMYKAYKNFGNYMHI